jgi:hypothetical protein
VVQRITAALAKSEFFKISRKGKKKEIYHENVTGPLYASIK